MGVPLENKQQVCKQESHCQYICVSNNLSNNKILGPRAGAQCDGRGMGGVGGVYREGSHMLWRNESTCSRALSFMKGSPSAPPGRLKLGMICSPRDGGTSWIESTSSTNSGRRLSFASPYSATCFLP